MPVPWPGALTVTVTPQRAEPAYCQFEKTSPFALTDPLLVALAVAGRAGPARLARGALRSQGPGGLLRKRARAHGAGRMRHASEARPAGLAKPGRRRPHPESHDLPHRQTPACSESEFLKGDSDHDS